MGPSTWPEAEVTPRNTSTLLQAARLRPFGVNYLQGAICPSLGLLAHLDGTSVHLLPFPPGDNLGEPSGACVASIDLSAGVRTSNPGGDEREVPRGGEKEGGFSSPLGVARSLSWTRCSRSALATSPPGDALVTAAAAATTAGAAAVASISLGGSGDSSHVKEGVEWDDDSRSVLGVEVGGGGGDKVSAHLAVACGSEVRLWEVSRFSGRGGAGEGGQREENESAADRKYRFSTVEVLTDWHRTIGIDCGGDAATAAGRIRHKDGQGGISGDDEELAVVSGDGEATQSKVRGFRTRDNKVRCMSFRPGGIEDARVPEREHGEEGVPLAVWYDTGAAVLGPGRKRATFPAPVAKKRACGAWSGCGRYLATSSGGEIRVHINPSGKHTLEAKGGLDACLVNASAEPPARAVAAWADSGSAVAHADGVLATEASEGVSAPWAKIVSEAGAGESGDFGGKAFRTVLCVEAALCGGGGVSSPGSSPGGPSTPSPRSTPSRRRGPTSGRHGLNDLTPPPSFSHMPSPAKKSDTERRDNLNLPSKRSAPSKVLMGDMRAMCPAGPSAFFGTTDGGLGVGSLFGGGSSSLGGSFTAVGTSGGRGQDLLGAVVSDSVARIAASGATDAAPLTVRDYSSPMHSSMDGGAGGSEDGDKHTRRGGFRHVLPGENWLAGSLRPRARTPPIQSLQKSPHSSDPFSSTPSSMHAQASRHTTGEANTMAGEVANLANTEVEEDNAAAANALEGGLLSGAPNSALAGSLPLSAIAPEVLDLRGKIGGLHAGAGGGAAAPGVTSTHPLFRLSLGGGIDPALDVSSGFSTSTPKIDCVDVRGGADIRGLSGVTGASGGSEPFGDTADAPSRRPWLMRVSCSSRTAGSSKGPTGAGSDGGVRVKTLAALPLELASPDLLASSDDGNVVAVGSHASGLVACYRLSVRLVAGGRPRPASDPAAREQEEEKRSRSRGGAEGVGLADGTSAGSSVAAAGGGGVRRRQKRLAVPLCTLRLPSGYRAKGLAFVKDGGGEGNGDGDLQRLKEAEDVGAAMRGAAIDDRGGSGSPMSTADGASHGEQVAVVVLAGCPVADPNAVAHPRQGPTVKLLPPASRSIGKSAAELSYRTVLLRFSLPEIAVDGGREDKRRSPCFSPKSYTGEHGFPVETSDMTSTGSSRNKDDTPHVGLGSSECLSGHGKRLGGGSGARTVADVGVLGREGEGDLSARLSSALAVDTGCASPARKQKTVAPPWRDGSQHDGAFSGDGGLLLQDELTRLSLSGGGGGGGGGRGVTGSSASVGVDDDGECFEAVARDARSVPEDTRPAYDKLVDGDGGGGVGAGSKAIGRERGARFEAAVLEGLAGLERRMGERLDRIERLMLGMCDRVGALEHSLGGIPRDDAGEKRNV